MNPDILILTSINTVENSGLPEDYYLHDTTGQRIEVWPGTYRLNLTKTYVAEYQARCAYQQILDSGLMVDGCFFDNFFTTQSWLRADIHGRAVQLDADEDGRPDDAAWLDREWKAGVYHELETWRALMPHALASGHLPRPPVKEFSKIFNGDSIGFMTADVIEGKQPFAALWAAYHDWWQIGREPAVVMVESSPHDQIAYGYDYSPLQKTPASTLEFAQDLLPERAVRPGVHAAERRLLRARVRRHVARQRLVVRRAGFRSRVSAGRGEARAGGRVYADGPDRERRLRAAAGRQLGAGSRAAARGRRRCWRATRRRRPRGARQRGFQ